MSLKTHPSAKNKTVKFDEYALLKNQIDRLADVLNGMNTRPHIRQNQRNRPYKPQIHRDSFYAVNPEVMT